MIQRRQADGVLQGAVVGLRDLPIELWASIEDAVLGEAYVAARRSRRDHHLFATNCYCVRFYAQAHCLLAGLNDVYRTWDEAHASEPPALVLIDLLQDLWHDYLRDLSEFEKVRTLSSRAR